MPNATITKFFGFVIATLFVVTSCHEDRRMPAFDQANSQYEPPKVVGRIKSKEISESSGLAASPCRTDLLWTHNDSGDGPFIYAIDASGESRGVWRIANADNEDWEDMAAARDASGKCFLYLGEIGNTDKLTRHEHTIYRVAEPEVTDQISTTNKKAPNTTAAEAMKFRYSDGTHDAETLIVHPQTGDIYILTKNRNEASNIYKLTPAFGSAAVVSAQKIGEIRVPVIPFGMLTGGSISPDGRRVILCDYAAAYELVLPDGAAFDEIWKQKPAAIQLGERKQGEAITYSSDGKSIFATSERGDPPVIQVVRKQ